jgi:hypothetical protein
VVLEAIEAAAEPLEGGLDASGELFGSYRHGEYPPVCSAPDERVRDTTGHSAAGEFTPRWLSAIVLVSVSNYSREYFNYRSC